MQALASSGYLSREHSSVMLGSHDMGIESACSYNIDTCVKFHPEHIIGNVELFCCTNLKLYADKTAADRCSLYVFLV